MKKNELKQRMLDIVGKAKAEKRELSKDEEKELENAKKEIEKETEADDDDKVNTSGDTSNNDSTDKETTLEKEEETSDDKEEVEEKETTVEEEKEDEETSGETTDDKKEEVEEEPQKEKEDNKRNKNININMEKKEFRLISALNDLAMDRPLNAVAAAVTEEGRNEQIAAGLGANGQIVLPSKRAITVTDSEGATVAVQVEPLLASLRDKMVLTAAGAKFLGNLQNEVKIPCLTSGSAKWESEISQNSNLDSKITSVTLKGKRLSCSIPVSLLFLQQSSSDAEAVLIQEIQNAVAEKLQQTILSDLKDATAPVGIFADKTPVALTDYKSLCDFEANLEDANINGKAYIMSNKAKAVLRSMPKSTKNTQLVLENGEVDGTPAYNTSSIKGKKLVAYGDWSYLYIAQFGTVQLTVDRISRAQWGEVLITVNAFYDAALVNPNAIAVGEFA